MLPQQQQQQQQQARPILAPSQSLHLQRMPNPRMPIQQQQVRLISFDALRNFFLFLLFIF